MPDKEYLKKYKKAYYAANQDKIKAYAMSNKARFSNGKATASRRGISWQLTLAQWEFLVVDKNCHYCGGNLPKMSCALDRKNNKYGYFQENVVPCCRDCNTIKADILTYEEMIAVSNLLKILRNKN